MRSIAVREEAFFVGDGIGFGRDRHPGGRRIWCARTCLKLFRDQGHHAISRLPSGFATIRVRKRLLIRVSVACNQVASSLDA